MFIILIAGILADLILLIVLIVRYKRNFQKNWVYTDLGPYRNLTPLPDNSGIAKSFKGFNSEAGYYCTIKVLRSELSENEDSVIKFYQESEALQKIKACLPVAPVPMVYATGTIHTKRSDIPFVEMENFSDNLTLSDFVLKYEKIEPELAEKIVIQIMRTLAPAHKMGIAHGNLKPSDILFTNGSSEKIVVCGFCAAKQLEAGMVGLNDPDSADYKSPEQHENETLVTLASDIYSLGVIFFELLTGKQPFNNESLPSITKRHGDKNIVLRISKYVPEKYQPVLLKMLSKNPKDRPDYKTVLKSFSLSSIQIPGYQSVINNSVTRKYEIEPQYRIQKKQNFSLMTSAGLLFILIFLFYMEYTYSCHHDNLKSAIAHVHDNSDFRELPENDIPHEISAPIKKNVKLSIESNISDASVFVDTLEIGKTPTMNLSLSPGEHHVKIIKQGYKPYLKKIYFDQGQSVLLNVNLGEKKPQPGKLYVNIVPVNAKVRFLNTSLKFSQGMELNPGEFHIEILAPGYLNQNRWVSLASAEEQRINILLEKEKQKNILKKKAQQKQLVSKKRKNKLIQKTNGLTKSKQGKDLKVSGTLKTTSNNIKKKSDNQKNNTAIINTMFENINVYYLTDGKNPQNGYKAEACSVRVSSDNLELTLINKGDHFVIPFKKIRRIKKTNILVEHIPGKISGVNIEYGNRSISLGFDAAFDSSALLGKLQ